MNWLRYLDTYSCLESKSLNHSRLWVVRVSGFPRTEPPLPLFRVLARWHFLTVVFSEPDSPSQLLAYLHAQMLLFSSSGRDSAMCCDCPWPAVTVRCWQPLSCQIASTPVPGTLPCGSSSPAVGCETGLHQGLTWSLEVNSGHEDHGCSSWA